MNDSPQRQVDAGALTGGAILIAFGILFFLDQIRVADFGHLIRVWWPLIIVAIGLAKIFQPGAAWSGLWLVAIGGWLQAGRLHLYGMTFRNSWPLLLIVFGGGIVAKTLFELLARPARTEEIEEHHGS